jgi:hypothetical protein
MTSFMSIVSWTYGERERDIFPPSVDCCMLVCIYTTFSSFCTIAVTFPGSSLCVTVMQPDD